MTHEICLDCGHVQQFLGNLKHYCSRCDRVTYHAFLRDYVRADGLRKEDFDLENHFAGGL